MGYYHIEISAKSKELCTVVIQWGKYEYQGPPMGLCDSPGIFQENMSDLIVVLDTVCVYIYDLLHVTKDSWTEHLSSPKDISSASRRLESRSTLANHDLLPMNLNN